MLDITSTLFTTRTIPIVDKSTRIVAVCGIADLKIQSPMDEAKTTGQANRVADRWFTSDFYAFKILLRGTGAAETWLTAEEPKKLVEKYGSYLHGSPYYERKVVLNQDSGKNGIMDNLFIVLHENLKPEFKKVLKEEAARAEKHEQSLLILMFGHGHAETYGILFRSWEEGNFFSIEDFKEVVSNKLSTVLVTTACFSSSWTIKKNLNISTMTAAGPEEVSESWMSSPSCGRCCGSIYATALLQAWSEESKAAESETTQPSSSKQELSYAAFTESVHDILFKVEKFAEQHKIHFSARDDDWALAWDERTGASLTSFKERWNSLPSVPATADVESFLNRAPESSSDIKSSDNRIGSLRARFRSVAQAAEYVKMVGKMYLQSGPDRDSLAPNIQLHGSLNSLMKKRTGFAWDRLQAIYLQLQYRMELMVVATQMLQQIGIPLPLNQVCSRFDTITFEDHVRPCPDDDISKRYHYAREKIYSKVLPGPAKHQGMPFNKPRRYICAALASWNEISSPGKIDNVMAQLEGLHSKTVTDLKDELDKDEDIRGSRKRLFSALGKEIRSLSPEKCKRC